MATADPQMLRVFFATFQDATLLLAAEPNVKCNNMRVVDTENWAWFLFEHEGHFYLDANCNMSAFGYTYMIRLNEEEVAAYKIGGHEYLNKLAHEIHYSVPIGKDTTSTYKGRDVSKELSELATEAVKAWREIDSGQ